MELLEGDLEAITRKLVGKAKDGEKWAIKIVMDKLIPPAKSLPVTFPLPKLEKAADLRQALAKVLQACSQGKLTPDEAGAVAGIMSTCGLAMAVEELERQLESLVGG